MAIANCIVTRIPLKEKLDLFEANVFFKLSTALEEDILKAGIRLKVTLNTMIIDRETIMKPGEFVKFWL
jgi:hypothetical protein